MRFKVIRFKWVSQMLPKANTPQTRASIYLYDKKRHKREERVTRSCLRALRRLRRGPSGRWRSGLLRQSLDGRRFESRNREELPGGRNRSRGGDGGNSTWVNPKERAKPWGERSEGLPLHSNTQTPETTPNRPKLSPVSTNLKRSKIPRKTAEYQKWGHPTVLTHGDMPLSEKYWNP